MGWYTEIPIDQNGHVKGAYMAKKKTEKPTMDLLTMMYQKGYKDGYVDGAAAGKKVVFDMLKETLDKADKKKDPG